MTENSEGNPKYTIIELLSGYNLWSEKKVLLFRLYFIFSLMPVIGLFIVAFNLSRRVRNHALVNNASAVDDDRKESGIPNLLPPSRNENSGLLQTEEIKDSIDKQISQPLDNIDVSSVYPINVSSSSLDVIETDFKAAKESVKRLENAES